MTLGTSHQGSAGEVAGAFVGLPCPVQWTKIVAFMVKTGLHCVAPWLLPPPALSLTP